MSTKLEKMAEEFSETRARHWCDQGPYFEASKDGMETGTPYRIIESCIDRTYPDIARAVCREFVEWCGREFKSGENIPEKFALSAAQELMTEFIAELDKEPAKS